MKDRVSHAAQRDRKRKPVWRLHGKTSTRIAREMMARRGEEARKR